MKTRLGVTLAAVLLVAAAAGAEQISNDAFSLTLPPGFGAFAAQTQSTTGKDGKVVETTNWISKAPTGEAVVVTLSKMPGKILNPDQMIQGTRDALLKTLNATVDSEEKIEGENPAARMQFHSANAFLRSRLVVENDRLYQLLYVGRSAEQRGAPSVGDMFTSFHINTTQTAQAGTK